MARDIKFRIVDQKLGLGTKPPTESGIIELRNNGDKGTAGPRRRHKSRKRPPKRSA